MLLHDYDYEVVDCVWITNLDADGRSRNPNPSDEDFTGATWRVYCQGEAVRGWHVTVYLTLFSMMAIEVPIQGLDDETVRPQAFADI